MAHVALLNLVFFFPAFVGASAFALLVYRVVLRPGSPDPSDSGGGPDAPPRPPGPGRGGDVAGPDDLARSA